MGISRMLFRKAEEMCLKNKSSFIEVNSSTFATPVYEKLGFKATEGIRETNGIKYIPMIKNL